MKKVDTGYGISFGGLKNGEHSFQLDIDNSFFEEFNITDAKNGALSVLIILNKKPALLELQIHISGTINVQCDRCLDYFDLPIRYNGSLYVKFREEIENTDPDILFIHPDETSLDLKQYIFECVRTCIPIKKIHPYNNSGNSGCNKEMIEKLNNYLISKEKQIDPRWDKLKDLL